MEVIVGKNAGFCFGITNAVKKTEEELKKNKNLRITYCLGELAHNSQVMDRLVKDGLVVIQDIAQVPKFSSLIIRAHGEAPITYKKALKNNINLIDLTCPKVAQIHEIIDDHVEKNYFILIIGDSEHAETIGHKGFGRESSYVIKDIDEIDGFLSVAGSAENILIVSQTTFSVEKFARIVEEVRAKIGPKVNLQVKNTICEATNIRQLETEELSKTVDLMIIVGGKKSSNTKKLYEIAASNLPNTICVETLADINIDKLKKYNKIGLMAGASTPQFVIQDIIDAIRA